MEKGVVEYKYKKVVVKRSNYFLSVNSLVSVYSKSEIFTHFLILGTTPAHQTVTRPET